MPSFRFVLLLFVGASFAAADAGAQGVRSIVPMTLTQSDYGGGRIYLPVRFGNVMGMMRLDTGASTTRLRLAPWNKGLRSLGESASMGASGATMRCEDVEVGKVSLRASEGNNVGRDKYEVSRCETGDGDDLLGLDFFKNARFTLDFERREMAFSDGAPAFGQAKPFRLLGPERRLVGIEAKIGKTSVVGLFDTGAEISAVDRRFVDKHKKLFTLVKKKEGASEASGARFSSKIYKIKALDLGEGRILREVDAMSYDFGALRGALGRETPLVIGYNVVSRFDWGLDFETPDAPTWSAKPR